MVDIAQEEFEALVSAALDSIPVELLDVIDNAVVLVEDEPPPEEPADLLGLYVGIPLTERFDGAGMLPDQIFVYRGPLTRWCRTRAELEEEIAVTVVHEIAHHFGISDARLHELGWD